ALVQFGDWRAALVVGGSSVLVAAVVGQLFATWLASRETRMNTTAAFIGLLGAAARHPHPRDREDDLRPQRGLEARGRAARPLGPRRNAPSKARSLLLRGTCSASRNAMRASRIPKERFANDEKQTDVRPRRARCRGHGQRRARTGVLWRP